MRRFLSVFIFCGLMSSFGFSQLDSVSVSVSFSLHTDSTFIDSLSAPSDFMTVDVWVNDPALVGGIMVSVYELQSGQPMARVNLSSSELQIASSLSGNTYSIPIGYLNSTLGYDVKINVQNFQLFYLPEVSVTYP